jgi:hypothetical protein
MEEGMRITGANPSIKRKMISSIKQAMGKWNKEVD